MGNFCFSAFVFGNYQRFIPFYVFSISKAYPNTYIKLFVDKPLEANIIKSLDVVSKSSFQNLDIIVLKVNETNFFKGKAIKGGEKKLIRWLFGIEYFKEFEYVYFGDIDIFYLREETTLMQFHSDQMTKLNLPFSNKIRIDESGNNTKRLTGLHCVKVMPYFSALDPFLNKIKYDVDFREIFLEDIFRDEHFLYKICKYTFQFRDENLFEAKRPWHGIHLGITRGKKTLNHRQILENSSLSIDELKIKMKSIIQDKDFKKIQRLVYSEEFYHILLGLELEVPFFWKMKYFKNNALKILNG